MTRNTNFLGNQAAAASRPPTAAAAPSAPSLLRELWQAATGVPNDPSFHASATDDAKAVSSTEDAFSPKADTLAVGGSPDQEVVVAAIEDGPADAELLRRSLHGLLGSSLKFIHWSTAEDGLSGLAARHVDILFLDYLIGERNGLDTLRSVRGAGFIGPIIVVTSQTGEYLIADLMRSGADDYVAKDDIHASMLVRAIRNASNQHRRRQIEAHNRQLVEDLLSAQRSLESKNRRLADLYNTAQQFVGNVSHEFRTPLTVIKEFSSILRDGLAGPINDEQRGYLDIVLNRTDDLGTMIDDMLDISRLEAGVMGMSRRRCRASEIIGAVRTTLERKAVAARVHMAIDAPDEDHLLYCDPEKIGRVLINLGVNAIKCCPDDKRVHVFVKLVQGESCIEFAVEDEGPGIPAESLDLIFERFKQIGGVTKSSTKGFGLGLGIAKELVHLNLGDIRVASTVGQGSTFSFTVPLDDPVRVTQRYLERLKPESVALLGIRAEGASTDESIRDMDAFLQHQLRRGDLLFSVGRGEWLLVATVASAELPCLRERINAARSDANRNRPRKPLPLLQWDTLGSWNQIADGTALLEALSSRVESLIPL